MIFGIAGWLMFSSINDTGMFWLTPAALLAKAESDPSFTGTVKVEAGVLPGSIKRNGKEISFIATDGDKQFRVVYDKVPPDAFADSASVILTGNLQSDGSFRATELLTKCASRFEAQPDTSKIEYRTPTRPEAQVRKATQ